MASSPKDKTVSLRTERAKRSGSKTPRAARGSYPTTRLRRNRRADWSRRLICENALNTDDLIWPIFVIEGERKRTPVAAMPGVERSRSTCRQGGRGGRQRSASPRSRCFPTPSLPCDDERRARRSIPPISSAARCARSRARYRNRHICDVALDPYTSHGHDGLIASARSTTTGRRGADHAGAGPG